MVFSQKYSLIVNTRNHNYCLVLRTAEEDKEKLKKISELDSLVLFGLLANEHRMSAIHFVMKRSPGFDQELKNKSELTFISGFRRFKCKPIFSQHTNGNKVRIDYYIFYMG